MPKESKKCWVRWLMPNLELPRIVQIERECFPNDPWTKQDFLSALRTMNGVGVVAEVAGEVAGYCIFTTHPDCILIANLGVDPAYQRQGVGAHLVEYVKEKLRPGQRTYIELEVSEYNLAGQLFFQSQGFRATAILMGYYEMERDAYRMRYDLPAPDERSYRDALWEDAWPL